MTPAEALASVIEHILETDQFASDGITEKWAPDILAALAEAGFVVVPEKPTRDMLMQAMSGGVGAGARTIWTAMLAARPR